MVRLFSCLLAIYSFTVDCLFTSSTCFPVGLRVDVCCFCLYSISFPIFCNRALIYCGEPVPHGLAEYMTRSGLPEFCSSLAAAMKAQACNSGQATESPRQTAETIGNAAHGDPGTKDCVCSMWGEWGEAQGLAERTENWVLMSFFWRPSIQPCLKPALPPDFNVLWANKVPFLFKIIELGFCPNIGYLYFLIDL